MKQTFLCLSFFLLHCMINVAQSLEECQRAAEKNYPLIRQFGLIEQTTQLTLENIQKGWWPQLSAMAQASYQNAVPQWPEEMGTMMQQMGLSMDGLSKDQYRIGLDISQTLFDGGAIRNQKIIAREQGNVEAAQNEVALYALRKRVNDMFFGLLLLVEQIQLNRDLQALLAANENKLSSMVKNGTAAQSDLNNVKAERLNAAQQLTSLESEQKMLRLLLSTFCGMEVNHPTKPEMSMGAQDGCQRPELKAFDAQLQLLNVQEKALDVGLFPKIGVFAQGFYGYPGYNMFEDMMHHKWSLNGMIGARLTWNISSLYTRKNDKAKIHNLRLLTENNREVFLFNNRLEQIQQDENMARYRQLLAEDEEIIQLRSYVRKAAESKLSHGIIDVNDLLREINQENTARLQRSIHEIELLKEIYDNKFTTNN